MLPVAEIILPNFSSNVPAFLAKLWKMVDDPDTNKLISWGNAGQSFVIHHQAEFAQSLLPYYYKHSNLASFVRQLNMYGFHKIVGVDAGGLKSEKEQEMEFAHPCFMRGQEILLGQIKRKVATSKIVHGGQTAPGFVPSIKTEKVTEVLNEVNQLKDKQEDMDSKLETMRNENEALWREVVTLRQKHLSQQKIVNKLIQFLVSLVQPRMRHGQAVKRRHHPQLAIEGLNATNAKFAKMASDGVEMAMPSSSATSASTSGTDPVILDVTDTHLDHLASNNPEGYELSVPTVEVPMSPLGMAMQAVNPSLVNPSIQVVSPMTADKSTEADKTNAKKVPTKLILNTGQNNDNVLADTTSPARPILQREISKEDFDAETMMMQKDIDNLKDLLSGQITLDSNLITNLFNPNEPLSNTYIGGPPDPTTNNKLSLQLQGNNPLTDETDEQPSLFDLADIDDSNMISDVNNIYDYNLYPSLETPVVTMDSTDSNPLLAQITKKGKKKRVNKS